MTFLFLKSIVYNFKFILVLIIFLIASKTIAKEIVLDCKKTKYKISNNKVYYKYGKTWVLFNKRQYYIIFNKFNIKIIPKFNFSFLSIINIQKKSYTILWSPDKKWLKFQTQCEKVLESYEKQTTY